MSEGKQRRWAALGAALWLAACASSSSGDATSAPSARLIDPAQGLSVVLSGDDVSGLSIAQNPTENEGFWSVSGGYGQALFGEHLEIKSTRDQALSTYNHRVQEFRAITPYASSPSPWLSHDGPVLQGIGDRADGGTPGPPCCHQGPPTEVFILRANVVIALWMAREYSSERVPEGDVHRLAKAADDKVLHPVPPQSKAAKRMSVEAADWPGSAVEHDNGTSTEWTTVLTKSVNEGSYRVQIDVQVYSDFGAARSAYHRRMRFPTSTPGPGAPPEAWDQFTIVPPSSALLQGIGDSAAAAWSRESGHPAFGRKNQLEARLLRKNAVISLTFTPQSLPENAASIPVNEARQVLAAADRKAIRG